MGTNRSQKTIRGVRHTNIATVYASLHGSRDWLTTNEISAAAGLSRPTTTQLLRDMEGLGVVSAESGQSDAFSGGRPPQLYRLNAAHHCSLILRLTHSEVQGVVFDAAGIAQLQICEPFQGYSEAGTALVAAATKLSAAIDAPSPRADFPVGITGFSEYGIQNLNYQPLIPTYPLEREVTRCNARRELLGPISHTVVATMGVVHRGIVMRSRNFPQLEGTAIQELLSPVVGPNIAVRNDAKLAALAGYRALGEEHRSVTMIGVHISEAIGCGIVINGRVVEGVHGAAGEIGTDRNNGWLAAEDTLRVTRLQHGVTNRELFAAAGAGETWAQEPVRQAAANIARGIVPLVLGLDPDLVVISGAIVDAAPTARGTFERVFGSITDSTPTVLSAPVGSRYVLEGARIIGYGIENQAVLSALGA